MKIVNLLEKDIDKIIDLDKAAFGDSYDLPAITEKEIKKVLSNGFIIGVKNKAKLLSNIQVLQKNKGEYYIYGIATLPEKQEIGLADKLLKKAIKMLKEKNAKMITATIKPDNTKSQRLFEKNGFKIKKLIPNCYGEGKDRLLVEFTFP